MSERNVASAEWLMVSVGRRAERAVLSVPVWIHSARKRHAGTVGTHRLVLRMAAIFLSLPLRL
jgi:hypothetical protein